MLITNVFYYKVLLWTLLVLVHNIFKKIELQKILQLEKHMLPQDFQ